MTQDFSNVFNTLFGTNKTTSEVYKAQNVLLPYQKRIRELETQIKFLAKQCANLSTKPHQQSSDYWLNLTVKEN